MPPVGAHEQGANRTFGKCPGEEPLPGYVLIEPLGRGGFGEVWKCEAPGGLLKAIKFVTGEPGAASFRQEYEAFQQVKGIRHPFLLSLERVELVGDELVMVMELADRQLGDRFNECRAQGLPGVPRDELLGYLQEAAEALDVIGARHGLQHLDVKPANLFLTAGHVQVGDYGLVSKLDGGKKGASRGLTPRYAAPEVLGGEVHTRSDQYSLALVYHEMLTGTFPFSGHSAQELMVQHVAGLPDLRALPFADRPVVARALAKAPEGRFESCLEFVQSLRTGVLPPLPDGDTSVLFDCPTVHKADLPAPPGADLTPFPILERPASVPRRRAVPPRPHDLPLVPRYPAGSDTSLTHGFSLPLVKLESIFSVVPVAWLLGKEAARCEFPPEEAVQAVLRAAASDYTAPPPLGEVVVLDDGTWVCRFLTTIDPRIAQVKLDLLWEEGGMKVTSPEGGVVVAQRLAPTPPPSGMFTFGKKPRPPEGGYELVVRLPNPRHETREVTVTAHFFGVAPAGFVQAAEREIVARIEAVRRQLNNVPERRKHPRVPAAFPVTVFPIHDDGGVELPVQGVCENVSAGGLALTAASALPSRYFFVAFDGVKEVEGLAILARIVRSEPRKDGEFVTARYRLDVGAGGVGA